MYIKNIKILTNEVKKLLKEKKYKKATKDLNSYLDRIKEKKYYIDHKIEILHLMGVCYYEIAKDTEDEVEKEIYIQEAIKKHKKQLKLSIDIKDIENSTYEQIIANFLIAKNYQESQEKYSYKKSASRYIKSLNLLKKSNNKEIENKESFKHEIYSNLVRLYIKIAMKSKDYSYAKKQYERANIYLLNFKELTSKYQDGEERARELFLFLKKAYLEDSPRNKEIFKDRYSKYLSIKKEEIQNELHLKNIDNSLSSSISTVLAILNIPPIELKRIPLAHYTSPTVCNKLFDILSHDEKEKPKMRIGSSTYMNDPSEGKGLLELLNIPEWKLENKTDCFPSNAFFTCFSSRVNDLNQFRLYGKEEGIEASGCCLVFNKKGNWLKEPNFSSSFLGITEKTKSSLDGEPIDPLIQNENLPLYQVAYIAYKDEYISDENFDIWLPDQNSPKFGIRLKSVGVNKNWQDFRIQELEKALRELITYFKDKTVINDNEKDALEYIRYLFKDFAFRDEEEFRLLKIVPMNSEEIEYCENTNSIYLPYANVKDMVDEVILGTNYEKTNRKRKIEVFQHLMKKECPNVSVSRSSLPIYANPPIEKN
jgi:UDP-N-acetylglucosamine-peptide-n-acetylglucosaminyltransferase